MDLEELIGKCADGWARYQRANADRIGAALDTGAALIDLRDTLGHGEFLPAVKRLGIGETTARNWMRLARAGLKTATVADLGGIRAALEHLRKHAKTSGEIRAIELDAEMAARRGKIGEMLAQATPDSLKAYAELLETQTELAKVRRQAHELIATIDSREAEIEGRNREIEGRNLEQQRLTAEIARLQGEIDRRRN